MTEEEYIFISDVHLGAFSESEEERVETELVELIHYAISKKAHLYILGDLFDYWMEFPKSDQIPSPGKKVLEAFEIYNRTVGPALYITGNHDNWTLGHFETLGFDVENEYKVLELDGLRILLLHGDAVFNSNGGLKRGLLHQILRNRTFLKLYRSILPPSVGIFLMRSFSKLSKLFEHQDPVPLTDNAKWATEHLPVDVVLCGHDHIPRTEHLEHGLYINTGTFFYHKTVARYVNGEFSLVTWKSNTKEFAPFS